MLLEQLWDMTKDEEMTFKYDEENDVLEFEHVDKARSIVVVEVMALAQEFGYVRIGYLFADEHNRDEGGSCFSMTRLE